MVSVWIRNRHGEFLLSQRHPDKPYPLYWECTGGSVLACESSLEGAVREVREELGLVLEPEHGRLLFQTRRERFQDLYDVWLFHADTPVSCLRLQETEVIAAQWVSRSMLFTMFRGWQQLQAGWRSIHCQPTYLLTEIPFCKRIPLSCWKKFAQLISQGCWST